MVILSIVTMLIIIAGLSISFYHLIKQRNQKKLYTKAFPMGVKAQLDQDLEASKKKLHLKQLGISPESVNPSTPRVGYRHNIHCPRCGRFSKLVPGYELAVECARHGIQVRWKDSVADWAKTGSIDIVDSVPDYFVEPVTGPISIGIDLIESADLLVKSSHT